MFGSAITIVPLFAFWAVTDSSIFSSAIFSDWFLSLDGQSAIVAGWMHSVRSDYPEPPYDAIPTAEITANLMPVDWVYCYQHRSDVRAAFEDAVKIPES